MTTPEIAPPLSIGPWTPEASQAHRVDLATWSGNERMMRCPAACGYREEARLTDARIVDGHRYDSIVMGRVRP